MPGIESFRNRLIKTTEMKRRGLNKAGGTELDERLTELEKLRLHIQATANLVRPGSMGIGTVGQATRRAAHGRLFDLD